MGRAASRIALESDEVALAAKRVDSHAADLRAAHSSTQASLDDSLYGCVGSSGDELARLSQRWAAVGARHGERLDALSRHVGDAGVRLTEDDRANAARVAHVGDEIR